MKIHPTAIIDPKAELHESVEVGPYSIIEGNVSIQEGTIIEGHVKNLCWFRNWKIQSFSPRCSDRSDASGFRI